MAGSPAGLYAGLLGGSWDKVAEAVRRAHATDQAVTGRGQFHIRHGDRAAARIMLRLCRLPAASEAASFDVKITPLPWGERWERNFSASTLVTTQREYKSLLAERVGFIELLFRLEVAKDSILFCQQGARLCAGPLRVPLPKWLAPSVQAIETATPSGRTHVSVTVTAPLAGRLISYEGEVEWGPA
jgi:hypothetical protein